MDYTQHIHQNGMKFIPFDQFVYSFFSSVTLLNNANIFYHKSIFSKGKAAVYVLRKFTD